MRWRRSRRSGTRTRPRSMATSLCSALVLAALLQAPPPPTPSGDSLLALRARLARDSTDGRAGLGLGRLYLQLAEDAHGPPHRALEDSAAVRALLDSSDDALARAGQLLAPSGSTPDGDSARVLRVGAWSARSRLAWDEKGINVGPQEWGPVPLDLKVPPVLEELGENLLRACPMWGVLFAALRLAPDNPDAWAPPALALYARAARATPPLCEALKTFRLTNEIPSCRR